MRIKHSSIFLLIGALLFGLTVAAQANLSPAVPSLVGPADGATDVTVPVTLEVTATDPDSEPLDVEFYGRNASGTGEAFTLMVIPDTQYYTQLNNGIFELQTQWIVSQKDSRNVFFATHEGDVVENWDVISQWMVASTSMGTLDPVIPYGINVGNHDMSSTRDTSPYNEYFGPWRFSGKSWYREGFPAGTNDNSYQLIREHGMDFLFLNLEFCPTAPVIAWADGVLKAHPNHRAVITTHGYLDASANRNVGAPSGGCVGTTNNTQYMWDQLIYPNPNVFLVLAGHTLGEARRTDLNIAGKPVYQLLADYQGRANGGNGWLRIMTFKPSEDKIYVETYSPYLQMFETDTNSKFVLDYDMDDFGFIGIATSTPSGSNAAIQWTGLLPVTAYQWFARVIDPAGNVATSSVWSFTTEGNFPPIANAGPDQTTNDADGNGTELVALSGSLSSDSDGTIVAYEWSEGSTILATSSDLTAPFTVGTHTVELAVTDNEGGVSSDTVVITITPFVPPTPAVHVSNIGMSSEISVKGQNRMCRVTAAISVSNKNNSPVSAASVSGAWSGALTGSVSKQTNTSGVASFKTNWVRCGIFTFTVNGIAANGYVYDPNANVETSDSITP